MTLAVVLLMGVFVTMYVLKSTGVLYVERSADSTHDEIMEPTGHDYVCEALVIRVFEQRLVDAGIESVEEMTTCDSLACKDCLPTRQAKTLRRRQEHKEAERKQEIDRPDYRAESKERVRKLNGMPRIPAISSQETHEYMVILPTGEVERYVGRKRTKGR